jgi:hypothetical protein
MKLIDEYKFKDNFTYLLIENDFEKQKWKMSVQVVSYGSWCIAVGKLQSYTQF